MNYECRIGCTSRKWLPVSAANATEAAAKASERSGGARKIHVRRAGSKYAGRIIRVRKWL